MRQGFSLVELSIVLVILGLLTGGILAGQSLIRASELRSVSTEAQRYVTTVHTFRDKYFSMPGDFRDGTRFWGRFVVAGSCPTRSSAAQNDNGTCDGDGDMVMSHYGNENSSGEVFQFWRQLALAGLIEGTYTGLSGPATTYPGYDAVVGTNVPRAKLNSGAWSIRNYPSTYAGSTAYFAYDYGNAMFFGSQSVGNTAVGRTLLSAEEAWNIDTKMDDGRPGAGKVFITGWDECSDAANNTSYTANYALNNATRECGLLFAKPFGT